MNMFFLVKVITSGIIIGIVTEISKKYTLTGGLIAAMPLTTLISLIWLYVETKDMSLLAEFSKSVFWGIFPALMFFLPAMFLFKKGYNFYFILFACFCCFGVGAYLHQTLLK